VQGVTVVGEDEPRGQRGLHKDEAVAIDSVDVPKGQGVQAREEDDALKKGFKIKKLLVMRDMYVTCNSLWSRGNRVQAPRQRSTPVGRQG
jgi:hypothetical protein